MPQNNLFWEQMDNTILQMALFSFEMADSRAELRYLARKVGAYIKANYPENPGKADLLKKLRRVYTYQWKLLPAEPDDGPTVPNAAILESGFNSEA